MAQVWSVPGETNAKQRVTVRQKPNLLFSTDVQCSRVRPLSKLNIQLRDMTPEDLCWFYKFQCDPESNKLAAVYARTEADFNQHWLSIFEDDTIVAKAIVDCDEPLGTISCFRCDGQDSIGYWIGRKFWGQGIATTALNILLNIETRRPLHARVAKENGASIRVLQKCGFEITGYEFSPGTDRYVECEEALLRLD